MMNKYERSATQGIYKYILRHKMLTAVWRIRDVYPGSRILIFTHPGSRNSDPGSRISDPGSRIKKQEQKRGVKKKFFHTFLCSHKFHKIENYFSFEVLKKKIWANFQRIIVLFIQKIVTKLSKIWLWDPGSGKNLFRIPDPGVKKTPDPGSATLVDSVQSFSVQEKSFQINILA